MPDESNHAEPTDAALASLFDANPLPMWIFDVETLRFLAVNDAAVHTYGYSRDEFLAMTIRDIRPPEDVPKLEQLVASESDGLQHSGMWRHSRKDGTVFDVEVTSHTVTFQGRNAQLVFPRDVSDRVQLDRERRRSEHALRQSEAALRALVDRAVFGMYRSTPDGSFTMVNQTLVDLLGYSSASELRGVNIARDVYQSPEDRDRLLSQELRSDVHDPREVEWKRRDGSPIIVRLSGRTVRAEDGLVEAYEMIVENVTERHNLEEQLRQAQKMEAVGLLAGGIAHDFNNLLATIQATAEVVRAEHQGDAVLTGEIEEILRAGERGAALVKKLLAFGRRQRLELRPVSLADQVREAALLLRRVVPASIEIKLAFEDAAATVLADPGAIEQILMNLATNARDAMPEGGTLLIQTFRSVLDETFCATQGWATPGEFVVLAVSDTGVGMDAETLRHVFVPFFTTKPVGVGTGLGLATVYGLAKQHLGLVHVYSEVGMGTSVKVYLPRSGEAASPAPRVAAAVMRGGNETILLAEDEESLRRAAKRVLEKHGYTVLAASDGVEALEMLRANAGRIRLVLSDVVMPRLGGPQFIARARAEGFRTPVLFSSGYTARDIEQTAALEAGVPLLPKPWTITDLLRRVRELLDEAAS
ncbi:MAG: PAS domain S-box protein [Gemmatimonadales bacterium]|nr:PAS domain S-box protein [Gemmatimonadales bacterium]